VKKVVCDSKDIRNKVKTIQQIIEMGAKCCGPTSAINCDQDNADYAQGGIQRAGGRPIRQYSHR